MAQSSHVESWVCWKHLISGALLYVMLALEDHKFEVILTYMSRQAWDTESLIAKQKETPHPLTYTL